MTRILVTSASGANGDGYGAILSFTTDGTLTGSFSQDRRITDPRGLSLDPAGELIYLNSGDDRVLALDSHGTVVLDSGRIDGLDPGGGTFGPDGRYYASEWPYGSPDAKASVREYDPSTGRLVRVFAPEPAVGFARPRGLRFGSDGRLYCVGKDHVISFDFATGSFTGVVARLARLNGQAVVLVPSQRGSRRGRAGTVQSASR
jgi:hypothetical protein